MKSRLRIKEIKRISLVKSGDDPNALVVLSKASDSCPVATQNVTVNLANRQEAISEANYGPLDPEEENTEYWQKRADDWEADIDEVKLARCGNCSAFNVSKEMQDCIAAGIGGDNAWDTIEAGDLGYCEAFDFKCSGSRSCDAWIVGGPITKNDSDYVESELLTNSSKSDKHQEVSSAIKKILSVTSSKAL